MSILPILFSNIRDISEITYNICVCDNICNIIIDIVHIVVLDFVLFMEFVIVVLDTVSTDSILVFAKKIDKINKITTVLAAIK